MKLIRFILIWAILTVALTAAFDWATPYDDTDDAVSGARSGVDLITDHGTGCQYLEAIFGGLTPRLDGSGKQMGCRL